MRHIDCSRYVENVSEPSRCKRIRLSDSDQADTIQSIMAVQFENPDALDTNSHANDYSYNLENINANKITDFSKESNRRVSSKTTRFSIDSILQTYVFSKFPMNISPQGGTEHLFT